MKFKKKLVKTSVFLFPYTATLAYSFILLETYTYPGLMLKSTFIDLKILILFSLVLGFVSTFPIPSYNYKSEAIKVLFVVNRLILPVLIFFYYILLLSSQNKYPNYIFATYHIHTQRIKLMIVFNLGLLGIDIFSGNSKQIWNLLLKQYRKKQYSFFISILTIFLIFLYFLGNIFIFAQHIMQNYQLILKQPLATHEEKSRYALSDYGYFNFLADYSDDNAIIAIPPQMSPWYTVGNGGYLRYFTYPKKVINSSLDGPLPVEANYAVIAKGSWDPGDDELYGWPKIKFEAEKIWYFDRETNKITESEKTFFDPTDKNNKYKWGLIKLKK
ncbi:MAG: hypothetical protein ABFQ62_00475 [Patescibacteria group bacterium]